MNVVITGASRGIGLELTKIALAKGGNVLAAARHVNQSETLLELKQKYAAKLNLLSVDFMQSSSSAKIAQTISGWSSVDLLINNAGIMRSGTAAEDFQTSFQVNTITPFLMVESLTPMLKKSKAPKAVHITSLMGSIQDNTSGGYYAYRSSKSALNMINKSLSEDLDWLTTLVLHPGWVKTDMGGDGAPTEAKDSAAGIWKIAEESTKAQSGHFYDFRGKELSW